MKRFYCPECGKQGYGAYLYFIAFLVIGVTIGICLVGCKDKAEASDPDEPAYQAIYDRVLSAEEIAEIDRKISEPDEPLLTIIIPDDPESTWKCSSCGQGFGEMFEVFCSCGKAYKTFDIIMKCIPTWPDYIELEKDLIIDLTHKDTPTSTYGTWTISKGTKIYFKE